jgi:coenzyme PQQ biosynthesis probable peptidase PqqF
MTPNSVASDLLPLRRVLPNGLRLGFIQLPAGSQAAALVRVHAGAHDAPGEYPGLAHFLEHLLFLGSHAYAPTDSLMPFVQGRGGQLNASTRERHTDFFFQVATEAFDDALKRLLDMLARPLLDEAAQLREREVLQAEFLARGRDRETLCDAAIGTALSAAHPFSAFHAGNRDTLPVEAAAFQRALKGYQQRFYHSGQMELLVAAPCSLEQLLELLQCTECQLPAAPAVARQVPPLRADEGAVLHLQVDGASPCLDLAFALDGLPNETCVALDVLGAWLASQASGSLGAALREAGWCDAVALRAPYWHDGQGVVVFEMQLSEQGMAERAQIIATVRSWLQFMTLQAPWPELWDEYVQIRQRGLLGKEPLSLLRYWIDPAASAPSIDASRVRQALQALGTQFADGKPIVLTVDGKGGDQCTRIDTAEQGFTLQLAAERLPLAVDVDRQWRLPERNRWLTAQVQPRVAPVALPALCWLEHDDYLRGQGALYLRWQFAPDRPPAGLWHALSAALRVHTVAAAQAGIELRFDDLGDSWCLALFGFAAALPLVVHDLLDVLKAPPIAVFDDGQRLSGGAQVPGADELLIRQLLRRLPTLAGPPAVEGQTVLDQNVLERVWQRSRWDALAVGLPAHLSGPLQDVLAAMPGHGEPIAERQPERPPRYQWSRYGNPGAETALVLFCPLPARSAAIEAAWRQLARLMESAFFRRLRSELQLGYAVFCGYRQLGERGGIVFAVQSPSATAAEILGYMEAFLESFAASLEAPSAGVLQALSAGESANGLNRDLRRRAEAVWQARLAGCAAEHPEAVAAAMSTVGVGDISLQLQKLRAADGGWHVVANADAPDGRWRQR